MKQNPLKNKKIVNKLTILAVFVLLQIGIIGYGLYYMTSIVDNNKTIISENKTVKEETADLNATSDEVGSYFDKLDDLKAYLPSSKSFSSLVEEIEGISAEAEVDDLDIVFEEGQLIDEETISVKSKKDKNRPNLKLEGIQPLEVYISIKGDYESSINFIKMLEKSSMLNNIEEIDMEIVDFDNSDTASAETTTPEEEEERPKFEYIDTSLKTIFYYREEDGAER